MGKGTFRSITSYGAFVDFGAPTDGLLHISQLSTEYVGDVNDIISEKQEIEVRIVSIDTDKGQVALSLLSEEESANAEADQDASVLKDRTIAGMTVLSWRPFLRRDGRPRLSL